MRLHKKLGVGLLSLAALVSPSFGEAQGKPIHLDMVVANTAQTPYLDKIVLKRYKAETYERHLNVTIPTYPGSVCMNVEAEVAIGYDKTAGQFGITVSVLGLGEVATFTDYGLDGLVAGSKDKWGWKRGYLLPPEKDDATKYGNEAYQVVIDAINAAIKAQK